MFKKILKVIFYIGWYIATFYIIGMWLYAGYDWTFQISDNGFWAGFTGALMGFQNADFRNHMLIFGLIADLILLICQICWHESYKNDNNYPFK